MTQAVETGTLGAEVMARFGDADPEVRRLVEQAEGES